MAKIPADCKYNNYYCVCHLPKRPRGTGSCDSWNHKNNKQRGGTLVQNRSLIQ